MKQLTFLFCLFVLISCSEKPAATETTSAVAAPADAAVIENNDGQYVDVPANAAKEEFTDTPGVVKVSLGADAQGTYKDGKRDGSWIEYHPNGLVKTITSYVDGKKEGLYAELTNNGQLQKRMYYHNNLRHGEYKEFNYSTVKEERTYQFDKLEGTVKIFYDNGKVMEEGNYKNGTRDGVSKWYDKEGNPTITYEYKNGELVKK
ncbi:MAG TPA: toxin-antitoxin system YwqK family antitoxin [Cyclobacteriaceae bacterium]